MMEYEPSNRTELQLGLELSPDWGVFFFLYGMGFHNICIEADCEIRKFDRIIMGKLLKQQQLKVLCFHQAWQRYSVLVELVKQTCFIYCANFNFSLDCFYNNTRVTCIVKHPCILLQGTTVLHGKVLMF
jgi:hypothetical protein